jgi:WD40 repeat protein
MTERLEGTGPLVVVGPSGAGKSSLLRAGVIPALRAGRIPGSRNWPCLFFTPGSNPIRELATRIAELAGIDLDGVVEELVADPARLSDILRKLPALTPNAQSPGSGRAVLVIDQFEETFTLSTDERCKRVFVQALCAAATRTGGRPPMALVVLGLRADFYGHCAAHPELVDSLRGGQVLLGAMDAAGLRDAIEKPARAVGMVAQAGLVEVMLGDLGAHDSAVASGTRYEPGALPLLSHSLLATWQLRDGAALTLEGYRLTGGIRGAIATTAERAYQLLDPSSQHMARRLLLRMIMIGEGVEDTRRRIARHHLIGEVADPAQAEAVLAVLAQARLVTLGEVAVEIAHEALLRAWPRLREWIETDRAGLLIGQQLTEAAEAWARETRHPAGLYQGPRLAAAREWVDTSQPELSLLVSDFLSASLQREHDEQRAARRRTRRLRQLVAGLGVLLLLATTSIVIAIQAREDAVRGRNEGISRKVASDAIGLRSINPALAGQLSLAAFRLASTAEARDAMISSMVTPDPTHLSSGTGAGAVRSAAFSPRGDVVASGGHDNAGHLWGITDSAGGDALGVLRGHVDAVRSVAFHPNGDVLATASSDRTVKLWDVADRHHPRELATLSHEGGVSGVAFAPGGDVLATAGSDRTARLWDITDLSHPREVASLPGHQDAVSSVAFNFDGTVLATGSVDRTGKLWDVADRHHPRELATLPSQAGFVLSVSFSPVGQFLATASSATTVRLWSITDFSHPHELAVLAGHTGPVFGLAFSPDGYTLATTSVDTTARLWNVVHPAHPVVLATPLAGHTDNVYSVAFGPDGHTLVTASHDQTVRLWETDPARITARICTFARPTITRAEWNQYFPGLDYHPPCPQR